MTHLTPVMERNFLEYASYVVVDRAIPDLRDGCKPVQRRILHTLAQVDDGKFHKVANVVGETMKLHPHGDASIYEALVVIANKDYFIEKQGNYGDVVTGQPPAAARYIECRLTLLAREALFNKAVTDFQPSYDGRSEEPLALPAKVPVILMHGAEGIAVGMATRILPHNFGELLQAQIKLLRNESIELYPDFLHGGIMDVSEYADGNGRVRVRAKIEPRGDKKVVITEIPFSTTTEALIDSIEAAAQKGKVKIAEINDFTTDRVEIELHLARGVYADEVVPQLYAYTDCEISINSNIVVIRDRHPAEMTVSEMLYELTLQLRDLLKRELEWELEQHRSRHHWLTLEQIFVENRVYKKIESQKTAEGVRKAVVKGMGEFRELFIRDMNDDDVTRLLELRIRRISQYDIDRNRKDIDDIVRAITEVQAKLKRMTKTTIDHLERLLEKYGAQYPRRTKISGFEQVDKRAVARANLRVGYDENSRFLGTAVRGNDLQVDCTEFDKVLVVCQDGSYRIFSPPEKVLMPDKVLHFEVFDLEKGVAFTVVYRNQDRQAYAKRIRIEKFINGKEYELIKGREGKVDLLLPGDASGQLHCQFVKAKRQRLTECTFDLAGLEFTAPGARGARIAPKPVARVKLM